MSKPTQSSVSLEEFCSKADNKEYLKLGEQLASKNVGKAFSLLSFGLSLNPAKQQEYLNLYLTVVENWSNRLLESSRYQDSLKIFEVAHDIYPDSPDLDYLLACTLYRLGKLREAWQYSLKVLSVCKNDPKARNLVSSLTNSLCERWHFPMINDFQRNKIYKDVIEKYVQKDSSVLDIGAGAGLLSIYSKRCGALVTYACEVEEFMSEMAASVLSVNNADDVVLLNKHSDDLQIPSEIPSRVSLVVTETFDAGLFGEHILTTLHHSWQRLILPLPSNCSKTNEEESDTIISHSRVIPSHAEVYVAIIECDYIARQIKLIRKDDTFKNIDVHLHLEEPYLSEKLYNIPGQYNLLTKWVKVLDVNFNSPENIEDILSGRKDSEFQLLIETSGRGDGIALSYKLFLDQENYISTFPESETCWENAVYPVFDLSILTKESFLKVKMEYNKVLRFKLLDLVEDSCNLLVPLQLLRTFNSSSFANFYRRTAEIISSQNVSTLSVLDDCPFPQGGLTLLQLNPDTSLFLGNENAFTTLRELNVDVRSTKTINERIDVIFFWPFTSEGTLKDCLLEKLKSYRKLLTKRGKIYPEFLDIQMLGIDSELISKMTRVEDKNTHGVAMADVFNIIKTDHHLDIPIEGISYTPHTPVVSPARLDLNSAKFTHSGHVLESSPNGYLSVGGLLSRSSLVTQSAGEGNITGFVYWFELTNAKSPLDQDVSSGSDLENMMGNSSNAQKKCSRAKWKHDACREELLFSSICRDSPVNQCVLLLDKPVNILPEQPLTVVFALKEEQFSVYVDGI